MGMYTKINLVLPIKKDTDSNTLNILHHIFEGYGLEDLKQANITIPEHPFFKENSSIWFPISYGSYYFTGTYNSCIQHDDLGEYAMVLHIDTDFKNYANEIDNFLDWIKSYLDVDEDGTFLGYSRYEEDLDPVLYYYKEGKILSHRVDYMYMENMKGE